MMDLLIMILATLGALLILIAAIGLVRMPDLYLRISVTTKAATLGVGLLLLCTGLYFSEVSITTRAIAIVFFLLLTAPIGAHLIGRSSYVTGVPLWKKTIIDELKGKYDEKTHGLSSDTDKKPKTESPLNGE